MEENKEQTTENGVINENENMENAENVSAENTSDSNALEETIKNLETQLAEQKDKYLRLYADFDNFKKRNAKERLELIQTAGKDIVMTILPALDDFERAQKAAETTTDIATLKEGMNLIYHKLFKALENKGLKPIEAIGKDFDVEIHEAITEIPAPSADMSGKVIDQVEKGYYLNDKIIRFSKVVVGK